MSETEIPIETGKEPTFKYHRLLNEEKHAIMTSYQIKYHWYWICMTLRISKKGKITMEGKES
jgi:hypothetical protein